MKRNQVAAMTLPPGKIDHFVPDKTVPGLALRLRASGGRTWVFSYRIGHKQRRMSLGSADAISVLEARRLAVKLYASTKLGGDPAQNKVEAKARAAETVGAVLPVFLARQKERLRPRSFPEIQRHLMTHAKRLHHMPLTSVTRRDVAAALTAATERLSGASVNRVRGSLSSFFAWCISEGLLDNSPVVATERREEKPRTRLITDAELRDIWRALRDDTYGDIVRLLILTGARREEIGGLRWSEIDPDRSMITLPGERTKNHRQHQIMLSAPAAAILCARPHLTWQDGSPCDLIFGRGSRPQGFTDWRAGKLDLDHCINAARNGEPMSAWTLHDIRRLVSTTMHEKLAVPPHIVEAILGHVGHQRGVAGVYNRADYLAQKRQALDLWADHLLALVAGRAGEVTPLRRAK